MYSHFTSSYILHSNFSLFIRLAVISSHPHSFSIHPRSSQSNHLSRQSQHPQHSEKHLSHCSLISTCKYSIPLPPPLFLHPSKCTPFHRSAPTHVFNPTRLSHPYLICWWNKRNKKEEENMKMKMYILGNWKISFIRFFSSEIKEDDKEKSGTQKWFISSVEPRYDGSTYLIWNWWNEFWQIWKTRNNLQAWLMNRWVSANESISLQSSTHQIFLIHPDMHIIITSITSSFYIPLWLCFCLSVCPPSHNQVNFGLPHLLVTTTFLSATQSTRSRNDIKTKCFRRAFSFILSRSHALNKFLFFPFVPIPFAFHSCPAHTLRPQPKHHKEWTVFVRTYNVCILMK